MAEAVQILTTINAYWDGDDAYLRQDPQGTVGPGTYYKYGSTYTGGYRGDPNVFPISNTDGGALRAWINLAEDLQATAPGLPASAVMGNEITINLPRQRSDYTHRVSWRFGQLTGSITSSATTSTTWTPPLSLASEIPNSTSATLTIEVVTVQGSKTIGTRSGNLQLDVPSTVRPTGSRSITETVTMPSALVGYWIQNRSLPRVQTTASGTYGSTIRSIVTTVDGVTYTGSNVVLNLPNSGSISVSTVITDSRGRTHTIANTLTVQAYQSPRVTRFWAARALSNGTHHDDGEFVSVGLTYYVSSVANRNTGSWEIQIQRADQSTWTTIRSGTGYTYDASMPTILSETAVISKDFEWRVRAVISDAFITISTASTTLPASATTLEALAGGKGLAFGKAATMPEAVDSAWPVFAPDFICALGSISDILTRLTDHGTVADVVSDWNDLTQTGIYYYGGGNPSMNGPGMYGKVLVLGEVGFRAVIVIGLTEIRFRLRTESGWKPWRKISSTAV